MIDNCPGYAVATGRAGALPWG